MISIDELTIDQVHTSYKSGAYTCRQLVEAYIERIKSLDQVGPKLNAVTVISPLALQEAEALDEHYKIQGSFSGPMHGVPVIVKDQCDTKGVETAYGNVCCRHVPTEDSTLVRKLREAGAVILAKSTMPGRRFISVYNIVVVDIVLQISQHRSILPPLLVGRL
jgi:Asp-tRNA(Asn)/Glu-tRNA(Gln) amidotransferase A subunit family amidase